LGAFNGGTGNGDWRLNVGDLAEIGTMRLVSWSLTLTGEDTVSAVPETSTWAAGAGLAGLLAARWLRRSVR
jgi:subtilisin-like proprotein convertase family protein